MNFEIAPNILLAIIAVGIAVPTLLFFNRRAKVATSRFGEAGAQLNQDELPGIKRTTVASHPIRKMVILPRYTPDKTVLVVGLVFFIIGVMTACVLLDITGHLH